MDDQDALLKILEAMTLDERRVFFQREQVQADEARLQQMIDDIRKDNNFIAWCISIAKQYMVDLDIWGKEEWLDIAEQYAELARLTKRSKFNKMKQIKKQREEVQCQRKKLKQMISASNTASPTSSDS